MRTSRGSRYRRGVAPSSEHAGRTLRRRARAGTKTREASYRDDLAVVHAEGFSAHAQAAALVLVEALRRRGIDRGLVVDMGCGSGPLSGAVVAAGYDALGVDLSPSMVALARRRL